MCFTKDFFRIHHHTSNVLHVSLAPKVNSLQLHRSVAAKVQPPHRVMLWFSFWIATIHSSHDLRRFCAESWEIFGPKSHVHKSKGLIWAQKLKKPQVQSTQRGLLCPLFFSDYPLSQTTTPSAVSLKSWVFCGSFWRLGMGARNYLGNIRHWLDGEISFTCIPCFCRESISVYLQGSFYLPNAEVIGIYHRPTRNSSLDSCMLHGLTTLSWYRYSNGYIPWN